MKCFAHGQRPPAPVFPAGLKDLIPLRCAATEPQRVFLHLQLIVLVGVAVAGVELPTLTKQVPPLLPSPLGGGRIKALFPTTLRLC